MKNITRSKKWKIIDKVKRTLFNFLRNKVRRLQEKAEEKGWTFEEYEEAFEEIHPLILERWADIEEEYGKLRVIGQGPLTKYLEGFLFEVLFYYSTLRTENIFLDREVAYMITSKEMEKECKDAYPAWFEATPLYDIVPKIMEIEREQKAPQTDADFLITFVDDKGDTPPAFVDVKSSKPYPNDKNKKRWGWQILGAVRRGCIFRIAYPKEKKVYPNSLNDWKIGTPCPECGHLNRLYRECERCDEKFFPS